MSMQVKPKDEGSVASPRNQPYTKLKSGKKSLASAIAQPAANPKALVQVANGSSNVVSMPSDEERAAALTAYNQRVKDESDAYRRWLYSYTGLSDGAAPQRTETLVVHIEGTDKKKTKRKVVNHHFVCNLLKGESWGNHSNTARVYEARLLESLERRRRQKEALYETFSSEEWEYKTLTPTSGWDRSQRPPTVKQLIVQELRSLYDRPNEDVDAIVDKIVTQKIVDKIADNLENYGTALSKLELDLEIGNEVSYSPKGKISLTQDYLAVLNYRGQSEALLSSSANDDSVLSIPQPEMLLLPSPAHFIMQDQLIYDLEKVRNPDLVDRESHELIKLGVSAKDWARRNEGKYPNEWVQSKSYNKWLFDYTRTQSLSLDVTRGNATVIRLRNKRVLKQLDRWSTPNKGGIYGLAKGKRGKVGANLSDVPARPAWSLKYDDLSWPGGPVYRVFPESTIRDDAARWYQWWCAVMISSGKGDEFRRQQAEYTSSAITRTKGVKHVPTTHATQQPQEEPDQEVVAAWSEEEQARRRAERLEREMPYLVLDESKLPDLPDKLDGSVDLVGPPAPPCFTTNIVDLVDRRVEPKFAELSPLDAQFDPLRGLYVSSDRVRKPILIEDLVEAIDWKKGPRGILIPSNVPGSLSRWLNKPLFK